MDSKEIDGKMRELLGFRVTERENDAVVEFYADGAGSKEIRAVRPAQHAEVTMYLRLIGFVAALDALTTENADVRNKLFLSENDRKALQARIVEASKEIDDLTVLREQLDTAMERMGIALQSADAQIKALMTANHGLGEERERFMEQNDQLEMRVQELETKLEEKF